VTGAAFASDVAAMSAAPARPPGLMEIAAAARQAVAFFTELPVDAVAACRPEGEGWIVVVDVVESRARLGDNDLIAAFEVTLDAVGVAQGLRRLRRYHRDDAREEAP
jgi:hypothetical protein